MVYDLSEIRHRKYKEIGNGIDIRMLEVGRILKMMLSNAHSSDKDRHFTHILLYQSSEIDSIISTDEETEAKWSVK